MVDVILGLQWGDEGKRKIVDFFAKDYDVIARFQEGPNAGHTLYVNDRKIVLHQIPSGVFHEGVTNLIGNGVVLDAVTLKRECDTVASFGIDLKRTCLFPSELISSFLRIGHWIKPLNFRKGMIRSDLL